MNVNRKYCPDCNKIKKINEFYLNKYKLDGLASICKLCSKFREKVRYQKSKEKIAQKSKIRYKSNQERYRYLHKLYYKNNKVIILKKQKAYHKKYPWKNLLSHIKQRCNNPKTTNYKHYGGRGIQNKFKNADEIKFLWFRDKAYLMNKPSIDRINNDGNYCIENCRFIELGKNVAERNKRTKKNKSN